MYIFCTVEKPTYITQCFYHGGFKFSKMNTEGANQKNISLGSYLLEKKRYNKHCPLTTGKSIYISIKQIWNEMPCGCSWSNYNNWKIILQTILVSGIFILHSGFLLLKVVSALALFWAVPPSHGILWCTIIVKKLSHSFSDAPASLALIIVTNRITIS